MHRDTTNQSSKPYKVRFIESAQKEYLALDKAVKEQLGKKLTQRLRSPHVPKDRLSGLDGAYKIKLRKAGVRLVYQVIDEILVVSVISVGMRTDEQVYKAARKALDQRRD